MPPEAIQFVQGGTMVALTGIAVFFARFHKETGDRFFLFFSLAFFLIAISQPLILFFGLSGERTPYSYWLRLAGFLLIIFGIIQKNIVRTASMKSSEGSE